MVWLCPPFIGKAILANRFQILADVDTAADVLWEMHPSFRSKFSQSLSTDCLVEVLSAMAADEATKAHVRLAKQDGDGSDTLCLRAPPCPRVAILSTVRR